MHPIMRLWREFDDIEKFIVVYFAHTSAPIQIDHLISFTQLSAFSVLNLMEKLKSCNVVSERKALGKGVYCPGDIELRDFTKQPLPEDEVHDITRKVIRFIDDFQAEGDAKTLSLAKIYIQFENYDENGIVCIKKAADILKCSRRKKESVVYYDYLIEHLSDNMSNPFEMGTFINSVYHRVSMMLLYPLSQDRQSAILKRAYEVALEQDQSVQLAKVKILLGLTLQMGASRQNCQSSEKSAFYKNDIQDLVGEVNDATLLKEAVFLSSVYNVGLGKFSEATNNYELVIGKLEMFDDSEEDLQASLLIAFSHVSCGRISRGFGMIDALRKKAQALNLPRVVCYADFINAAALIGLKKVSEAKECIEKPWALPEDSLDTLFISLIYCCKAYVYFSNKKFELAFKNIKKGFELRDSMGRGPHPLCPWLLECIYELEANGFSDETVNFTLELNNCLGKNSLFIKGVALRYRALVHMHQKESSDAILTDLENSEKLLSLSGTEIELARTRVVIKQYYSNLGKHKLSTSYLEKVWHFLSKIDPKFFPNDLLGQMPWDRRFELTIERITRINNSIGILKNHSIILENVINVAMDLTMAMHGGFFILEEGELKPIASRGLGHLSFSDKRLAPLKSLLLDAIRKEKEISFPKEDALSFEQIRKQDIRSLIGIPVKLDESVYGYLILFNHLMESSFSYHNLLFARMLASQAEVGLSNIRAHEEIKKLKDRFEDETHFYKHEMGLGTPVDQIVGQSNKIKTVIQQVRQVAPTDSSVLLLGETGVGKELVAKAVHNLSVRKDGPFIPVNLTTFPQDLIASELFGYEKGAFTGASGKKKGRFELADGGTIFLDEIGELNPGLQVKLLRVLQERVFERLGGSTQIQSDFRVIAATNKNLRHEVEKGNFRQDLYYRLNVFPIHIPPLRERKSDIKVLSQHFLKNFAKIQGKPVIKIPDKELTRLMSYHWPGNVRELEHSIERAVILSNGYDIQFHGLDFEEVHSSSVGDNASTLLADIERKHIEKILSQTLWKISGPSGAAALLGLKPSTLYHRMKKLGIQKPESGAA